MGWLKQLYKQTTTGVPDALVLDYPVGQYKAYWETITTDVAGGISSEVRFNGFNGEDIHETFTLVGPTKEHVKERMNVLIKNQMAKYKR